MKRGLLLGMAIALVLPLSAMAASVAGAPDSIIIASVAITPGQTQVAVPIYFVTHEDVTHYTLPLRIESSGGAHFSGVAVSPALQGWDDNWQGLSNNGSEALHLGFADLGGEDNPSLNTAGQRVEAFQLLITLDDGTPTIISRISARVDARTGAPMFGCSDGVQSKTPVVVSGTVAQGVAERPQGNTLPTQISLDQNFPNPFNPTTEIAFGLPESRFVKLTVFNVLGQEVRSLVSGVTEAGFHKVVWDGRSTSGMDVPSGVYFYRLDAGSFTQSMKMILLK